MARFLISQQKYLELLEQQNINQALTVLRDELAPLKTDIDKLQSLSGYALGAVFATQNQWLTLYFVLSLSQPYHVFECGGFKTPSEVGRRCGAVKTGSSCTSATCVDVFKSDLLPFTNVPLDLVPPATLLPERRFVTLLEEAFAHQRSTCLYHNSSYSPEAFSLFTEHQCGRSTFPMTTTNVLTGHDDEVWNVQWSHNGMFLASASKDKTVRIWRFQVMYCGNYGLRV